MRASRSRPKFLDPALLTDAWLVIVYAEYARVPVDLALTGVRRVIVRVEHREKRCVLLAGEPPVHDFEYLEHWRRLILAAGIDVKIEPADDDVLVTEMRGATGERSKEQVLGREDVYDEDRWVELADEGSIEVLLPRPGLKADHARRLARLISSVR